MSTLIRIGCLVMTPEQLKRALDEDLTMSQTLRMIEADKRKRPEFSSPLVSDTEEETPQP